MAPGAAIPKQALLAVATLPAGVRAGFPQTGVAGGAECQSMPKAAGRQVGAVAGMPKRSCFRIADLLQPVVKMESAEEALEGGSASAKARLKMVAVG